MSRHNSRPRKEDSGWNDKSGGNPAAASRRLPQHLPFIPILAERGNSIPTPLSGGDIMAKHGSDVLDLTSPYFSHSNLFLQGANELANIAMTKRFIPPTATKGGLGLALELVECERVQYERKPDGTYKLDADGALIPSENKLPGFKGRWVRYDLVGGLGQAVEKAGALVGDPTKISTIYPLLEAELPSEGKYGDLNGIRFFGPTIKDRVGTDPEFIKNYGQFLYRLQFVEASDATSTPKPLSNTYGTTSVDFCLGLNVLDKSTQAVMSYDARIPNYYLDGGSSWGKPMPMNMELYDDNIAKVLDLLYASEQPHNASVTSPFEINFANGVDVNEVPYYTIHIAGPEESGLFLSDSTNIMASGSSDGDISVEVFDKMVGDYFTDLATNESHELRDRQRYPFRQLYDSGFVLETKYAMIDVMSVFPDVNVTTGPQAVNDTRNSLDVEYSVGLALATRYKMHPESTMYGTPAARGTCVIQSGFLPNSTYRKLVPQVYSLFMKRCAFGGAANGVLKGSKAYDLDTNNVVSELVNLNHVFVPETMRNQIWDAGLTYSQTEDQDSAFFPAIQTIYADKTSVLLSDIVMNICCYITSLQYPVWRKFTGNSKFTPSQIKTEAAKYFTELTKPSFFDNRVRVDITVTQTKLDRELGYAYTPIVKVYANNMALLMDFQLETYRMESGEGA